MYIYRGKKRLPGRDKTLSLHVLENFFFPLRRLWAPTDSAPSFAVSRDCSTATESQPSRPVFIRLDVVVFSEDAEFGSLSHALVDFVLV